MSPSAQKFDQDGLSGSGGGGEPGRGIGCGRFAGPFPFLFGGGGGNDVRVLVVIEEVAHLEGFCFQFREEEDAFHLERAGFPGGDRGGGDPDAGSQGYDGTGGHIVGRGVVQGFAFLDIDCFQEKDSFRSGVQFDAVIAEQSAEIGDIDAPIEPNIPEEAQIARLLAPPEAGGGDAVEVIDLHAFDEAGVSGHEPGTRVGSGQKVEGSFLDDLDLASVLAVEDIDGMVSDSVYVDFCGTQKLSQAHSVPDGNDNGGGFDLDTLAELIGLHSHLEDHLLQDLDTGGGAGGDEVFVGGIEERLSIEDVAVLEEQLIDLTVDLAFGDADILGGHTGEEADIVIDEGLAGHGELGSVGIEAAS